MSSLSWDVPSSSSNPSVDDDDVDVGEVNGRGRTEGAPHDDEDLIEQEASEREQIEAMERELLEQLGREQLDAPDRDQLEALEREELEQFEREQMEALEQLGAAEMPSAEQSERDELEELEREQLRQLEQLEYEQNAPATAPPRQSAPPPPAAGPRPEVQPTWAPSAADAEARAALFLAASERRGLDEAALPPSAPTTELRELSEPARAARAIVDHRHRNLVEANALLTEARKVLAPIAYRGLSDRIYRRRKVILAIGEAVSLAVAFSTAFDVAPLEALLLSGAIALAFVIAGDLGGILRLTAERSRLSAAMDDDVVHLDPRYLHILYHDHQPWLSIIGGVTAAIFGVAAVSVGVLRASNQGSVGLAAGLGLLTVSLAIAAGLSSWQHASVGSEIIDHLQREEEAAARRLKRAAAARVLRRPQLLGAVRSDEMELPLPLPTRPPDMDWAAPDGDWQAPTAEMPVGAPRGAGRRAPRQKPAKAKREKRSGSLAGAVAARGAVFLATLPGKLRRSEDAGPAAPRKESKKESKRESKIEDMSVTGDGPGALGESAGPISAVAFRPPIQSPKKFG